MKLSMIGLFVAAWMNLLNPSSPDQITNAVPTPIAPTVIAQPKSVAPIPTPKPIKNCTGSQCIGCVSGQAAQSLIQVSEGLSYVKYIDDAGYPTIGIGHLIQPGETFPKVMTHPEVIALYKKDVANAEKAVNRNTQYCKHPYQFDALTSFFFNIGEGKLIAKGPGTMKAIRTGNHPQVPVYIRQWKNVTMPNGQLKPLRGLVIRREAEARLYEGILD